MTTEAGEFMTALKKHVFYGKELDLGNLEEEVGDMLWYCALASHALKVDFDVIMWRNIAKLKKRFSDRFTEEDATNRDLEAESEALIQERQPENRVVVDRLQWFLELDVEHFMTLHTLLGILFQEGLPEALQDEENHNRLAQMGSAMQQAIAGMRAPETTAVEVMISS